MTTWAVADLPPRLEKRVTIDAQTGCWRVGGYRDRDEAAAARRRAVSVADLAHDQSFPDRADHEERVDRTIL